MEYGRRGKARKKETTQIDRVSCRARERESVERLFLHGSDGQRRQFDGRRLRGPRGSLFLFFFTLLPSSSSFFFFAKLRGNWPPATPTSLLPPRTRVTLPRAAEYCIGRLKGLRIGGGAGRGWRKKKGVHRACKRKREDDGSSAPFLPSLLRHLRPLEPRRLHHGSSLHITRRSNATPRRQ